MSVIDPTEARFHADDPPGVILPPGWLLLAAFLIGVTAWFAVGALAARLLGWA
ncbi:MAG: hypothetical protein R3C30_09415 [Hyphomonadaceae bacterium]